MNIPYYEISKEDQFGSLKWAAYVHENFKPLGLSKADAYLYNFKNIRFDTQTDYFSWSVLLTSDLLSNELKLSDTKIKLYYISRIFYELGRVQEDLTPIAIQIPARDTVTYQLDDKSITSWSGMTINNEPGLLETFHLYSVMMAFGQNTTDMLSKNETYDLNGLTYVLQELSDLNRQLRLNEQVCVIVPELEKIYASMADRFDYIKENVLISEQNRIRWYMNALMLRDVFDDSFDASIYTDLFQTENHDIFKLYELLKDSGFEEEELETKVLNTLACNSKNIVGPTLEITY